MTDEKQKTNPQTGEPVYVASGAVRDASGVKAEGAIAIQGDAALLIARFADMDAAKAAYRGLLDAETKRAIDIDAVLVANSDYQGKINIQKMTDHTTRTGFAWGAVAGVVLGVIFPPSILASAATLGIAGAAVGKLGNEKKKSE